jgi:adenylosuccinate synthase
VGWLDLPLLRYAARFGGLDHRGGLNSVILTKLDVLNDCEEIQLCVAYTYTGPEYWVGDTKYVTGMRLETAVIDADVLYHCTPEYKTMPGWCCTLKGATCLGDLPRELRDIIEVIEHHGNVKVDVLSIGPERDETIVL